MQQSRWFFSGWDTLMSFHISHRYGGDDDAPPFSEFPALLAELDEAADDPEHRDVAVTHESGWSLGIYYGDLVVLENVEELDIEPRHMQIPRSDPRVLELMRAVASGSIDEALTQPWQPGYGQQRT
jgi:hypothetical protein